MARPNRPGSRPSGHAPADREAPPVDPSRKPQRRDEDGFACEYDPGCKPETDTYTITWDGGARWLIVDRYGLITAGQSPANGRTVQQTTWEALMSPTDAEYLQGGDWSENLDLSNDARRFINKEAMLLSLLYDLDLLPEQLLSQDEKTPGLIKAYHRLYGVLYGYRAAMMVYARASDGSGEAGETEGLDPQGDSAVGESRGAHE